MAANDTTRMVPQEELEKYLTAFVPPKPKLKPKLVVVTTKE